jgi:hypothetical protein
LPHGEDNHHHRPDRTDRSPDQVNSDIGVNFLRRNILGR